MELGLRDRVAIVAAASKGLGKAVALGLAREGARVTIFSRDEGTIRTAGEEIGKETGAEVLALAADVTREEDLKRVVDATLERWGRVDILFNNAGGPPPGKFDDFGDADWQRAFELNFLSTVRLTRLVLPTMRERRWGRIINSTSTSVKQPIDNLLLSNAIRSAVVAMSKTLSNDVAPLGITINTIGPGRIRTERLEQVDANAAKSRGVSLEEVRRQSEAQIPMGRYGSPEEFAALAVFLASEPASYITGQTLIVDGGMVKGTL
jgi:3-oxoacyl-[acyl-carrier protein] reductase